MKRLLRQDLICRIKLSGHDVDVDADAELGDNVVKVADGRDYKLLPSSLKQVGSNLCVG